MFTNLKDGGAIGQIGYYFRISALGLFILRITRKIFSPNFWHCQALQPTVILTIISTSSTELYEDDLMIGFFILVNG